MRLPLRVLLAIAFAVGGGQAPRASAPIALPFTLADTEGQKHALGELKGTNSVVYFFCGCEWCQQCARAWGEGQRNRAVSDPATEKSLRTVVTVVIFAGNKQATRAFAAANGLDARQTLLLPDPDLRVTNAYHAQSCPRAFVLDANSVIRYTNNHAFDAPRKASAQVIVGNVSGALAAVASAANVPVSGAKTPSSPSLSRKPSPLTVVMGEKVVLGSAGQARYLLGLVDTLQTPRVEHTFFARNSSKVPVTIAHVESSCGCTSVLIGNSTFLSSRTLKPGEQIGIKVAVETTRLHAGEAAKQVWLYAPNNPTPLVTLELTGTIQPPITLTPEVLDFGRVSRGNAPALPFTVAFDPRLVEAGVPPVLLCTNPGVEIVQDASNLPQTDAKGNPVFRYQARMAAQSPLGPLRGDVVCMARAVVSSAGQKAVASGATAVGPPLTVVGEVIDRRSAVPGPLAFGEVASLSGRTRVMTIVRMPFVPGCSVASDNPRLTARLLPAPPALVALARLTDPESADRFFLLEARLEPQTPPGDFHARLTVQLPDRTRFLIPVSAQVLP